MHRIGRLDVERDDGVAAFMIGGEEFFFFGHHERLALGAHHHLVLGVLELRLRDHALVAARGHQGSFVDQVRQIGTGETGRTARDGFQIHVGRQRHLAHVNFQNLFAADNVRIRHDDLTIETAGTQQRGVQHVRPVGGRDQDDTLVRLEAVHLDQQLIERLFALVVAAAETSATMTADRVNFVDEDDAGRVFLGLLEHVAHAACTDADKHLDEVGTRNGEERHVGFARDGACEQGLAGAGRTDEQHTARNAPAEFLEFSGITQEFDDLMQIVFRLVDPGDIVKGDAAM